MIGVNAIKNNVAVVRSIVQPTGDVQICDYRVIDFSTESGSALVSLRETLRPLFQQWVSGASDEQVAILKCSEGLRRASGPAFKAEGIAQMVAAELGIKTIFITPQSLPKCLGCGKDEKWKDRAKALMNPTGEIKQWTSKGIQGAAAAAYKALKK